MLNRTEPNEPADPDHSVAININTSTRSRAEVETAIKAMKGGKVAGIDSLQAELLKAENHHSLHGVYRYLCQEMIPKGWSRGLISKIPKKGDLSNCNNWRGTTRLSIPSKVYFRGPLKRIDCALDVKLRKEQAGFRKFRGCIDQISALRNIIEQRVE